MSSKLREALNQLLGLDNGILVFDKSLEPSEISHAQYHIDKAGEAYEEPLKNCEVGTAEEQYNRFIHCCTSRKIPCRRSDTFSCTKCYAVWSQLPYESEVNE